MEGLLRRYGFITLTLLVGIGGLAASFWRSRKALGAANKKRSLFDYWLVWPLLFGNQPANADAKSAGRILSNRVIVGWLIVIVLGGMAMFFNW